MSGMLTQADMVVGVQNMIEASGIEAGNSVLLLTDSRSDRETIEAVSAGLTWVGATPMVLETEVITRYGDVPAPVQKAMAEVDVCVWVWPVFLSFTPYRRGLGRGREKSGSQLTEKRKRPYHVYFEGNKGLLARDYARFPNKVLWTIAEVLREIVSAGSEVTLQDKQGTNLTATYDGDALYGMQFRPGDPPGRCHFPWGRCGVYDGTGTANGEVVLAAVQGVTGLLNEPLRWTVKDSMIVGVDGGQMAEECLRVFEEVPGSNRLIEIMFGYHPKASSLYGIADPMHWELISSVPWVGLGTTKDHPSFRHIDGAVIDAELAIDGRVIVSNRTLDRSIRHHAKVRAVASEYGDPDRILASITHEAPGIGSTW